MTVLNIQNALEINIIHVVANRFGYNNDCTLGNSSTFLSDAQCSNEAGDDPCNTDTTLS